MWDDMYPLKLTARKFHTMLSNLCGIAVRKAEDFIMDSCCAAGSINLCENGKQKKKREKKHPHIKVSHVRSSVASKFAYLRFIINVSLKS